MGSILDSGSMLPQNILAFQTITTLLSGLRKAQEMTLTCVDEDHHHRPRKVRQELRILNALATVLVRKHEVVAVVALHNERPQQGEHEEHIQAIACSLYDEEQPKPSQMCSTSSSNLTSNFWKGWTTGNY